MKRAALVALALLAACADSKKGPGFESDWEREHAGVLAEPAQETLPTPPAQPRAEDLLPFDVGQPGSFRYFVDPKSIGVSGSRVQYTLVARSPSGVGNVSFEAIDCRDGQFRSFARGSDSGAWIERATPWRPIRTPLNAPQFTLYVQYFCPNGVAVHDVPEAAGALRAGGHPYARPGAQAR
ncbi:MAG: CNP1-like family protein [Clostridia bacterium]